MSTSFWDPLWRSAGIQFVVLFVIAYFVAYSRLISPIIGIAWIVVISAVLLRSPSAARMPDRAVVPQW